MKICPAFRIQSVKWIYHIGLSIQQETKKKGQNDCYDKGTGLTLAVGWEDSEFIPERFILKLLLAGETFNSFLMDGISKNFFFSLSWFFLKPNWLVKICLANRIQSKRWTYQIGLSIQDKETRLHFGCCPEIQLFFSWRIDSLTAIGWEDIEFLYTGWNLKKCHKICKLDRVGPSFRM